MKNEIQDNLFIIQDRASSVRNYLKYSLTKENIRSFFQQYIRYFWYNLRETRKRKLGYFLGVLSCFVVVATICISVTTFFQLPIIFLRLAENSNGQFDMKIGENSAYGTAINYTQFQLNIEKGSSKLSEQEQSKYKFHSSRIHYYNSVGFKVDTCMGGENLTETLKNNTWMYWGTPDEQGKYPDCKKTHNCADEYCSLKTDLTIYLFDTEKEKDMGFGRIWTYPRPKPGEGIIDELLAETLGIKEGDIMYVHMINPSSMRGVWKEADIITDSHTPSRLNIYLPIKIGQVIDIYDHGKYDVGGSQNIFIDLNTFLEYAAPYTDPDYRDKAIERFSSIDITDYSEYIYINMKDRIQQYNHNDYETIQGIVADFASSVSYFVGFDQISSQFPIFVYLRQTRFFSLFIGLIINIIITVLTLLSVVLIYSLLLINVENRTFELGVLRMIGMKRLGIIQMVLIQSMFYSIPGIIFGLLFAQGVYVGVAQLLQIYVFEAPLPWYLNWESVALATALGVFIPLISAIFPIRTALTSNLTDSLDTRHSKTKAVKYSIERASDGGISYTQIVVGSAMAIFGFGVYYAFPLALLTFNITLLLYMFFGILLGMLLGLVVLSLNLENITEQVIAAIFFFWENVAIRNLMLKNLVAHRLRNRKTTIMYALSLGFLIFIAVSFKIQIRTFQYQEYQQAGARLRVVARSTNAFYQKDALHKLEDLARTDDDIIDYAYITYTLHSTTSELNRPDLLNLGKYERKGQNIQGVSPNFYKVVDSSFLVISQWKPSGWDISEQLYSERGSASMVIGSLYSSDLNLDEGTDNPIFLESVTNTARFPIYNYTQHLPIAFLDTSPVGSFSKFPGENVQSNFVSLETYAKLNPATDSFVRPPIKTMFFKINEAKAEAIKRKLRSTLQGINQLSIDDLDDDLQPLSIASTAMDVFFYFTTVVAMILCLLSLFSSMYTNINDQSKEIGILRAIGARKFTIVRLYIYEAFILVMAASIMGVGIGVTVAYTMTLQQILFTQLPIGFIFPWELCLIIFGLTFLFSFISAIFPILSILRLPIVLIMRRFVS